MKEYIFTDLERGRYSVKVTVKDKAGNASTSEVLAVETILYTAPKMETYTFSSKTNNSITIRAKATDQDGEQLTYTLYTSTNGSNWTQMAKIQNVQQNIEQTLIASGLSAYTYYYWKVDVTDGTTSISSGGGDRVRTYCSSNYCSGGSNVSSRCSSCSGTGKITCTKCSGSGRINCTKSSDSTAYLVGTTTGGMTGAGGWNCSGCGKTMTATLDPGGNYIYWGYNPVYGCRTCGTTSSRNRYLRLH